MVLMKRAYKNIFLVFVIIFGLSSVAFAEDVALSSADPTILTQNGGTVVEAFAPELDTNSKPSTDYYYGVHAVSISEVSIPNVQVKITVEGPESLTADMVHIDEVGWYDPNGNSLQVFHYPFIAQDGTLIATGSCTDADDHSNGCVTDTWEVDPLDDFTNVDKISFSEDAPAGIYTIRRQLVGSNVSDEFVLTTLLDTQAPVTTKTYGDPNTASLISVPSCNGDVVVNGHFITTGTTITLSATDPEPHPSGVSETEVTVLVPVECEQKYDFIEYVGITDYNIYEDSGTCSVAVEGEQDCVATYWQLKREILREGQEFPLPYEGPFVIPQESTHKICFFSIDNAGNEEDVQCQVVLVDDSAPTINSAEVDHDKIDLEYFDGQIGSFDDPKCANFIVSTTDTHEIDEVQVDVHDTLNAMFYPQVTELPSFDQEAWENYISDSMHVMPAAELNEETGNYTYEFCAVEHIYHLYSMDVINWGDLKKLVSEKLELGEFEFPIEVNDTTGKSAHTSVNLIIVDLTVPLEEGWNLRSTPIRLEGDEFWPSHSIDAVLKWNSSEQAWELVTDNSMEPLDALYIHATDRNQYGIIFERDLTSPPVRQMNEQWNLVGTANQLFDSLQNPNCDEGECSYLTYLNEDYTYIGEAFGPLVYDANGNRALEVVISPHQELDYSNDWGSWNLWQDSFVWIPQIEEQGADPDNYWEENVENFGGYWVFMQNEDLLPGFTTTPVPINGD